MVRARTTKTNFKSVISNAESFFGHREHFRKQSESQKAFLLPPTTKKKRAS